VHAQIDYIKKAASFEAAYGYENETAYSSMGLSAVKTKYNPIKINGMLSHWPVEN
jgi:hypothetical protein